MAALLAGLDEAVALEDGEVLADAGGGEAEVLAQLLDGGVVVATEIVENVLTGRLHAPRSLFRNFHYSIGLNGSRCRGGPCQTDGAKR